MFWRYRCKWPNEVWVVIAYHAKSVADLNCAYFDENAASSSFLECAWNARTKVRAFESMFKGERQELYTYETTNPQAEVMVKDIIPSEYIEEIFFNTDSGSLLAEYKKKYPNIKMSCKKTYFEPRRDYQRWSKGYALPT